MHGTTNIKSSGSVQSCHGIPFTEVTEMCHFTTTRGLQRCDFSVFTAQLVVFDVIVWPSSSLDLCVRRKFRDSDWLRVGRYGLRTDIFLSKPSRPPLGPTQSPSEWIRLCLLVIKPGWPEGNRCSVVPCWRTNGAAHVLPRHAVDRNKFTFSVH